MAENRLHGIHRRPTFWLVLAGLTLVTVLLGVSFLDPSPPKKIVLATGQAGGMYDAFGREYQRRLEKLGLRVELVQTNGSVDNLQRLVRGQVDVAFAQGGTAAFVPNPHGVLRGLATLYGETIWVFYRGSLASESLGDLQGRRISAGPTQSGTEAVAKELLRAHGVDLSSPLIVNLSSADARQRLQDGRLDAAFFVTSYRDPGIRDLLRQPGVRLLNFRRDVAYTRQFPYLTPVKLTEGLLDLRNNIPSKDTTVLAAAAMLVAQADLHPQVVEAVLKVAQAVHSPGSLVDPPLRYPSLEGLDLPIHETADAYLTSGESFLSRLLPYWALRQLLRLRIVLLPLFAVWLPFLKVLPMISAWRAGRWLERHYRALDRIEGVLTRGVQTDELRAALQALEKLQSEMDTIARKVSGQRLRDVYHWRAHVGLLQSQAQERLRRLEGSL